jgi:hypothetical protein
VFRSCTPIAICTIEYLFMNREFPSIRSIFSLLGVVTGAILYCLSDSQLQIKGLSSYGWVFIYFCSISIDMTYGKALSSSVPMESTWGSVYYCNSLSIVPFVLMGVYEGNLFKNLSTVFTLPLVPTCVLIFSCIVGTFIG